ncbi:uncharacterized protein UBRO_20839 [Ustilago bromivora]|uniref:Uncharacterized protein n=1 Tax=Ustilago bromivora TaxID=307758 RepID=A0A1K0HCG5_9BASI|nr:uncharacterized protein UBRO_20839 [Ustilago bromivora]
MVLQPQPHTAAPPPPQSCYIPAWSSGFPTWPSDSSRPLPAPVIFSASQPAPVVLLIPHTPSRETSVAIQPQPHTATPPPPQSFHIPAWSSGFPMQPSDSSRYLLAPVIIPASQPAPATLTFSNPLQVPLADLASPMLLSLQTLLPPARPNTTIAAPLHPSNGCPSRYGTMQAASGNWTKALLNYLDHPFVNQLLGAIDHGVHLGYSGPLCSHSRFWSIKNLPMDNRGNTHI